MKSYAAFVSTVTGVLVILVLSLCGCSSKQKTVTKLEEGGAGRFSTPETIQVALLDADCQQRGDALELLMTRLVGLRDSQIDTSSGIVSVMARGGGYDIWFDFNVACPDYRELREVRFVNWGAHTEGEFYGGYADDARAAALDRLVTFLAQIQSTGELSARIRKM